MLSDEEDTLIDFLEEKFGCHTVILYGSRIYGTARPDSDWDVLALHRGGDRTMYHGQVEGVGEVNAYIYPEYDAVYDPKNPSPIYNPGDYLVRLRDGRVLVQEMSWGDQVVRVAKQAFQAGPPPFSPSILAQWRYQLHEYWPGLLEHPHYDPVAAQYIRHRMVHVCLDLYFRVRGLWPTSPKESFMYFREHDPAAHDAFVQAMAPDATVADFRRLANAVMP